MKEREYEEENDVDDLDFQDNPQLANWKRLKENREIWDGNVSEEIGFERPTVAKGKDGQVSINGGPFIRISPSFEYRTAEGKIKAFSKATLFTWTSKMSCPSFSIPAGPKNSEGTCIAARRESITSEGSYEEYHPSLDSMSEGQKFICDLCYAGKGRYLMYKSMSIGQMAKLAWVNKTLTSGTFARRMSEALASLVDEDVERVLAAKNVSNRFFRIHDAGDFFSPEYYRGWRDVCDQFTGKMGRKGHPLIYFWAPTRIWVYEKYRRLFENYPPPPNLALRPSALFTSAPPPQVDNLAEGSTSIDGRMPAPVWNCPAYEGAEEVSCAAVKCRVCWTRKEKPVNYLTH